MNVSTLLKSAIMVCSFSSAALADNKSILGFESANSWTIQSGTVRDSVVRTEGFQALAVRPINYSVVMNSAKLTSIGPASSSLKLDLMLPPEQVNPQWHGSCQAYIEIPSKGVFNSYLGQVELSGKPLGQYQTLAFAIPASVRTALAGTYTDLTIKIVLNVPSGSVGTYRLDAVRFNGTATAQIPLPSTNIAATPSMRSRYGIDHYHLDINNGIGQYKTTAIDSAQKVIGSVNTTLSRISPPGSTTPTIGVVKTVTKGAVSLSIDYTAKFDKVSDVDAGIRDRMTISGSIGGFPFLVQLERNNAGVITRTASQRSPVVPRSGAWIPASYSVLEMSPALSSLLFQSLTLGGALSSLGSAAKGAYDFGADVVSDASGVIVDVADNSVHVASAGVLSVVMGVQNTAPLLGSEVVKQDETAFI